VAARPSVRPTVAGRPPGSRAPPATWSAPGHLQSAQPGRDQPAPSPWRTRAWQSVVHRSELCTSRAGGPSEPQAVNGPAARASTTCRWPGRKVPTPPNRRLEDVSRVPVQTEVSSGSGAIRTPDLVMCHCKPTARSAQLAEGRPAPSPSLRAQHPYFGRKKRWGLFRYFFIVLQVL